MNEAHKINKIQSMNKILKYSLNELHSCHESNLKRKGVILYELDSLTNVDSLNKMQTNKMKRIQQMKTIKEMNKTELIELVNDLQSEIHVISEDSANKDQVIIELQLKLESSSKDGRKSQVLDLLRKHETISILEISRILNISTKNVSSQLTYLRSDNYKIFTDHRGRKMLIEDQVMNEVQSSSDDSDIEDDSSDTVDSDIIDDSDNTEDSDNKDDSVI